MGSIYDIYKQLRETDLETPDNNPLKISKMPMRGEKYNPSCGDRVKVGLSIEDGIIKDIHHYEEGCMVCSSSTRALTRKMLGKTPQEAIEILCQFEAVLEGDTNAVTDPTFLMFAGLRKYPARVGCARIPVDAFKQALIRRKE